MTKEVVGSLNVVGSLSRANYQVWDYSHFASIPVASVGVAFPLVKAGSQNVTLSLNCSSTATADAVALRDANADIGFRIINCTVLNWSEAPVATAATHYAFDYGDGYIRRKTLANVKTEIVTGAAVVAALSGATLTGAYSMGNYQISAIKYAVFNSVPAASGSTTTTYTTDFGTGQKQKLTLTGTITATLAFSFPGVGHFQLHLLSASSVTLVWPTIGASWQWLNSASAPSVNTGTYGGVVNIYYDGTIAVASYSRIGVA
jgi:hypothetical protein